MQQVDAKVSAFAFVGAVRKENGIVERIQGVDAVFIKLHVPS